VEGRGGDLVCMTEMSEQQMETIDKEKEKAYILGYLFNIWKEQIRVTSEEYQELERSWREG
jgi:hypothetical protein